MVKVFIVVPDRFDHQEASSQECKANHHENQSTEHEVQGFDVITILYALSGRPANENQRRKANENECDYVECFSLLIEQRLALVK